MKKLYSRRQNIYKKSINEGVELLTDIDSDNIGDIDLLPKNMNSKYNAVTAKVRNFLRTLITLWKQSTFGNNYKIAGYIKQHSQIVEELNDPANYKKYANLIAASDKKELQELLTIGTTLLGETYNFNWIDTSHVTDMSELFNTNRRFNGHIELWDVSNVTTMKYMFSHAGNFNTSISDWDVSNVTSMKGMFELAVSFNQNISNWDVRNVTTMERMFKYAYNFNQNINNWNVYWVENMSNMFMQATRYNQPLDKWNVKHVENMSYMFAYAREFNQNINTWNVSSAKSLAGLFYHAESFNQPLDNWDVSNCTMFIDMFNHAYNFNQDISNWKMQKSVQTYAMFEQCGIIPKYMPVKCRPDLTSENLKMTYYKYLNENKLNILSDIEVDSFDEQPIQTKQISHKIDATRRDVITQYLTNMINGQEIPEEIINEINNPKYFKRYANLIQVNTKYQLMNILEKAVNTLGDEANLNWINTENINDMSHLFNNDLYMYFNGHIELWDVSNVTAMACMFYNCCEFNCDITNWNVSKVVSMANMFRDALSFTQDLTNWDVSNVEHFTHMFVCSGVANDKKLKQSILYNWNMPDLLNAEYLFSEDADEWLYDDNYIYDDDDDY